MATSSFALQIAPEVLASLKVEARRQGLTVEMLANQMLKKALGDVPPLPQPAIQRPVERLAGKWTDAEADEFLAIIASFDKVDEELWQ